MATRGKKTSSSYSRRAKPMTSKAGVTRSGKRRYGCGGSMKKK